MVVAAFAWFGWIFFLLWCLCGGGVWAPCILNIQKDDIRGSVCVCVCVVYGCDSKRIMLMAGGIKIYSLNE